MACHRPSLPIEFKASPWRCAGSTRGGASPSSPTSIVSRRHSRGEPMAQPDSPASVGAAMPPFWALKLIDQHERRRETRINLVASENIMSSASRAALRCDLAHRYVIPLRELRFPDIWDYPNQDASQAIEHLVEERACTLFHGRWADVHSLSGKQCRRHPAGR